MADEIAGQQHEIISGTSDWEGYYTRRGLRVKPVKKWMRLELFIQNDVISGKGTDPVGDFLIDGACAEAGNEVEWEKVYPGRHTIFYSGYVEKRYGIWGTWNFPAGRLAAGGNFHIWKIDE